VRPAVVSTTAAMTGPGRVKHTGHGDLIVSDRRGELERLAALFARAGVWCTVSDNIEADLWAKMAMNCAPNGA